MKRSKLTVYKIERGKLKMERIEVLKEINGDINTYLKAKQNIYRGKVFAVVRPNRIDKFFKTKRGANGYIEKQSNVSWYDEITFEMYCPGTNLEIIEIKESELVDITKDSNIWYQAFLSCAIHHNSNYSKLGLEYYIKEHLNEDTEVYNYAVKQLENLKNDIVIEKPEAKEEVKENENIITLDINLNGDNNILEVEEVENNIINNIDVEIIENKEKNGIELKFNDIPNVEIRTELKNNGFRWHRLKKVWYAKQTQKILNFVNILKAPKNKEVEKVEIVEEPEVIEAVEVIKTVDNAVVEMDKHLSSVIEKVEDNKENNTIKSPKAKRKTKKEIEREKREIYIKELAEKREHIKNIFKDSNLCSNEREYILYAFKHINNINNLTHVNDLIMEHYNEFIKFIEKAIKVKNVFGEITHDYLLMDIKDIKPTQKESNIKRLKNITESANNVVELNRSIEANRDILACADNNINNSNVIDFKSRLSSRNSANNGNAKEQIEKPEKPINGSNKDTNIVNYKKHNINLKNINKKYKGVRLCVCGAILKTQEENECGICNSCINYVMEMYFNGSLKNKYPELYNMMKEEETQLLKSYKDGTLKEKNIYMYNVIDNTYKNLSFRKE